MAPGKGGTAGSADDVRPTLRSALAGDADRVVALWLVSGAEPTLTDDPGHVVALLARDPGALIVAVLDEAVVGTVIAGWDGWRGNIYRLVVHPDHRRRGLARALVHAAERRLAELGATRVNALVVQEDNRAVGFWTAIDYPLDARTGRHVRTLGDGGAYNGG